MQGRRKGTTTLMRWLSTWLWALEPWLGSRPRWQLHVLITAGLIAVSLAYIALDVAFLHRLSGVAYVMLLILPTVVGNVFLRAGRHGGGDQ